MTDAMKKLVYKNEHISETVKAYKNSGKKVVGILPVYAPYELVHASGMFPVGCWGGQIAINKAPTYLPAFGCSIMQSITEMAMSGVYSNLDALVISTPCDTLRCAGQNLKSAITSLKHIYCITPTNNKSEAATQYYKEELKRVKESLEELSGHEITKDELNKSIELYNENRSLCREFAKLVADKPEAVSANERHAVLRSRLYMDIEEHSAAVKEINEWLKNLEYKPVGKKKLFLAGITAEPKYLLDMLDEEGFTVVADELAQEWRQISTDVPESECALERLAKQYQNRSECSLILDYKKSRFKAIVERSKAADADAVLYCQMHFCDPEEQDYPWAKRYSENEGLKMLCIEINQNTANVEQLRTKIQTFKDLLS